MEKIVFECEAITPMFMYGADGITPELRPASIKGVMRFWWRAIFGDSDIERLREAESEIFGSTNRRSKVNIRVCKKEFSEKQVTDINEFDYLFFSIKMQDKEKSKKYFEKIKFDVILTSRDEKVLKEASYSFILLSLFGGLGSRSRRGGGNFRIKSIDNKEYNTLLPKSSDRMQLITHLFKIFNQIKKYFQQEYPKNAFTREYSNLSILDFVLSYDKFDSWNKALKDIETKYKDFRKNEHTLDNVSFGLPIKSEHIEVFTNPKFERRASPMIIKILKVQNQYYWFVLKLNGEFLPSDTKIKEKKDTIYKDIYENIVDDFLGSL